MSPTMRAVIGGIVPLGALAISVMWGLKLKKSA